MIICVKTPMKLNQDNEYDMWDWSPQGSHIYHEIEFESLKLIKWAINFF